MKLHAILAISVAAAALCACASLGPPSIARDGIDYDHESVQYHGDWFWIDEGDYPSKGIFSFVTMIFPLMDSAPPRGQPIVTVPAG